MNWLIRLFTGPVVDAVVRVAASWNNRKVSEAEMRKEMAVAISAALGDVAQQQANVIRSEATGESWLQRNWRPMVAVSFATVVLFYGLFLPIAVDWLGAPPVRVGDELLGWIMQAVVLCLGGYIGGRSLEKIARVFGR